MTSYYSTTINKKNIDVICRVAISEGLKRKDSITEIARNLKFSRQAIHNEIRRGTIEQVKTDLTVYKKYDIYAAQYAHENAQANKGRLTLIDDYPELATIIEKKIKQKYSPEVIEFEIKKMYEENRISSTISYKTIYNLVHSGRLRVRTSDLLYCKNRRNKKYKHEKTIEKPTGGESIDLRPDISDRIEFGHWEIDCVVGKREGKSTCLMTLVERKTRYGITMLIPKKSKKCIVKAISKIKAYYGKYFYDIFKTITADNGSEFKDALGMSMQLKNGKRVRIYFAHAYHSWERGTNENYNRMIRRYFPKGTNFEEVTKKELKIVIHRINKYPRKLFKYKTSKDLFLEELTKIIQDREKAIELIKGL